MHYDYKDLGETANSHEKNVCFFNFPIIKMFMKYTYVFFPFDLGVKYDPDLF